MMMIIIVIVIIIIIIVVIIHFDSHTFNVERLPFLLGHQVPALLEYNNNIV